MTTPFMFSYILVDMKLTDVQGHSIVGVYPLWTNNINDIPICILHSSIPPIIAKIYPGNPYPDWDYTAAVERRIKLDIQRNAAYDSVVASQINDNAWHLHETTQTALQAELLPTKG